MVAPPRNTSEKDRYVAVMKALSDPTRLEMIRLIAASPEYACTSLERELPVSKSTISYHVKILSHADLLSVRREGKFFFYRLHKEVLDYYSPNLLVHLQVDASGSAST
jgi:ArsR family transcriptional regulator